MKRVFFRLVAAFTMLLLVSCAEAPTRQVVNEYDAHTVEKVDAEIQSLFSASIRGRQDIAIVPQVSGTIAKVSVTEGQMVNRGQTLFIIDQVPYQAALLTAEANVKAAEAGVATAELTLESRQELFAKGIVSEFDLRLAENQLLTANAALAQAKAQEINARNSLGYTVVKAPATGVVGTIPYRVGALVGPSIVEPLTTVSDNSDMYVYFSMNETHLLNFTREYGSMDAALKALPKPELILSDGSVYSERGYIESISGVIDRSTGAISLRAVFPNPGRLLHSGGTGNIRLSFMQKDCLVIPCIATYEVQDKVFVYKVVDGVATSQMVEVKRYDGKNYIVISGLEAGDTIVTEGVNMLREGTPIKIKGAEVPTPVNQNQQ